MDCIEYAKEFIQRKGFRIEVDTDYIIGFKYQMHVIHLWKNETDDNFACVALTNFIDVTPENEQHLKELCHEITANIKQIKMYLLEENIMSSAEFYFKNQDDFNFQLEIALKNLIGAKTKFIMTVRESQTA